MGLFYEIFLDTKHFVGAVNNRPYRVAYILK